MSKPGYYKHEKRPPFSSLDWATFEQFCRDLIRRERPEAEIHVYAGPGDGERDLVVGDSERVEVVQCKCLTASMSLDELLNELAKLLVMRRQGETFERVVFYVSSGFVPSALDLLRGKGDWRPHAEKLGPKVEKRLGRELDEELKRWIEKLPFELAYRDAARLNDALRDHGDLLEEYFEVKVVRVRDDQVAAGPRHDAPSAGLFVGRERELTRLDQLLRPGGVVSVSGKRRPGVLQGAGGIGKTMLARKAAELYGARFEDVIEIHMDGLRPGTFAMELGQRLGREVQETGDVSKAKRQIEGLLARRKLLLLLDNVSADNQVHHILPHEHEGSVVLTTRDRAIASELHHSVGQKADTIDLEAFSEEEVDQLFREALPNDYNPEKLELYRQIAALLGNLPVVLRPAINLMVFRPRYSAERLLEKLKAEPLLTAEKGARRDEELVASVYALSGVYLEEDAQIDLLARLAVCAPGPTPLDFLARMGGDDPEFDLERLVELSWCRREERDGVRCYALHDLVRTHLLVKAVTEQHEQALLEAVDRAYLVDESVSWEEKDRWVEQVARAAEVAEQRGDRRLWTWMRSLVGYCARRGHAWLLSRLAEAVGRAFAEEPEAVDEAQFHVGIALGTLGQWQDAMEAYERAAAGFEARGYRQNLANCWGNQALILRMQGKWQEAFALHQREERLKQQLGDQQGLANCWGNQAMILRMQGKRQEAFALHQREERLKQQLGDQQGLAYSWGNQALILADQGKRQEALALHQREERLKQQLGDQQGLANCWGNQALILRMQGKWQEAFALHQREERLKQQLGDQQGLAYCWGNQALILQVQGKWQEAFALHQRQERLCEQLGDQQVLAYCRGNQALILADQGKWQEALDLLRREEQSREQLGDQQGLARNRGNQATILQMQGKQSEALAIYERVEDMCEPLGYQQGLARNCWNRGILHNQQNHHDQAKKLLRQAFQRYRSLKCPIDKMEHAWSQKYPNEPIDDKSPHPSQR